MHDYIIKEMADLVCKEIGSADFPAETKISEKVESALEQYWADKIACIWSVEDVHFQAKQDEVKVTDEQAVEVLELVHRKMDANLGINWDVLSEGISTILREQESL